MTFNLSVLNWGIIKKGIQLYSLVGCSAILILKFNNTKRCESVQANILCDTNPESKQYKII